MHHSISAADFIKMITATDTVLIDARQDSAYSGYLQDGVKGHLKGAIQFPIEWLANINPAKLAAFIRQKGIDVSKQIVVYDSDPARLEQFDAAMGPHFKNIGYFSQLAQLYQDQPDLFEVFPGYKYIVSADWLNALIKGGVPDTMENTEFAVFDTYSKVFDEFNGDPVKAYDVLYRQEHIPGAGLIEINRLEGGPSLNILDFTAVKTYLEEIGIHKEMTVIVYSRNPSASFRTALILLWAGVNDVRILNGGFNVWKALGLPLEQGENRYRPVADFGREAPLRADWRIADGLEAYREQQENGRKLVSARSWNEHTGNVGGYDSVPDLDGRLTIGEPKGAIWGFSGSKIRNMEDYYDPDGTLRNPLEIAKIWQTQGLDPADKIAFFCGTGWRACLPLFMSKILGWPETVLYDGSWLNWQQHEELPLMTAAELPAAMPDALNDYR